MTPDPAPKGKFDWQRLILSLEIPLTTKAVALALSIYASRDGGNAHPGGGRLAWAVSADEKTVRRHLAVLRDELRLIERTFHGSTAGRRGLSDCYRLVIPWDLPSRVKIRQYDPEHRTPESADSDPEQWAPESGDLSSRDSGTPDSEAGTPDSEAGTPDSRVHPPGSNHHVYINHHSPIRSPPSARAGAGARARRHCPACGVDVAVMSNGQLRPHGPRHRCKGLATP